MRSDAISSRCKPRTRELQKSSTVFSRPQIASISMCGRDGRFAAVDLHMVGDTGVVEEPPGTSEDRCRTTLWRKQWAS